MAPTLAVARSALALALGAWLPAPALGVVARTGHPIERVIGLLQDLEKKAEQEGKDEEVLYTKFEYWCTNSKKTLEKAVAEETSLIERLSEAIASHEKREEVLKADIAKLGEELQALDVEIAQVTQVREEGRALYQERSTAHSNTIKAIQDAVTILEQSKADTAALMVLRKSVGRVVALLAASGGSQQARDQLSAFAEEDYDPKERPDLKAAGDDSAHVQKYGFKSQSVIELLKELKLKFEDELTAMNTEETNAENAHTLGQTARDQLKSARLASKAEQESALSATEQERVQAQADLDSAQGDLTADSESLRTTGQACDMKRSEWAERSEVRANEIKAIEKAVEILGKATGVRTEAPTNPGLPPPPEGMTAFVQFGSPRQQKALDLLRKEAVKAHSSAVAQLADELAAQKEGPFDQVVNAIQKMIFRLQHEQKEEDDHKNWCDLELSKTNTSIDDKSDKLEELSIKIQNHDATAIQLAEDIRKADDMIAAIDAHMKEATEIRSVGRAENAAAIKDSEDARTAITSAIAVLKDFYKSSGAVQKEAYELLQRAGGPVTLPETPSTWDSGYTAVADPAAQPDGIVTVLEQISADFGRMEADTKAQEETDQNAYDSDMKSSKIEKARRAKEAEMKTQERKRVLEQQSVLQSKHKAIKGELEATEQYMHDLQPACVEGSSTYEDRKMAREMEIEALQEAQGLLQGAFDATTAAPPASFLQQRRRLRGVA